MSAGHAGLLREGVAWLCAELMEADVAAQLVTMLLFVIFDLDRPTRGPVTIPDTPFTSLRASMELPPAAE